MQTTSTIHTFICGVNTEAKDVSNVVTVPEPSVLIPGKY